MNERELLSYAIDKDDNNNVVLCPKIKNKHHSVPDSNRHAIAKYDIIFKYYEKESGNFSGDNLHQDLKKWPVNYTSNASSSEL